MGLFDGVDDAIDNAADAVDDTVDEAVDTAQNVADDAVDTAEDVADTVTDTADDVADAATDVAEDVGSAVDDAVDSASEGFDDVTDSFDDDDDGGGGGSDGSGSSTSSSGSSGSTDVSAGGDDDDDDDGGGGGSGGGSSGSRQTSAQVSGQAVDTSQETQQQQPETDVDVNKVVSEGEDAVKSFFEAGAEAVQSGSDMVEGALDLAGDQVGAPDLQSQDLNTPEVGIPFTNKEVDVDNIVIGNQDDPRADPVLNAAENGKGQPVKATEKFGEQTVEVGLDIMQEGGDFGEGVEQGVRNTVPGDSAAEDVGAELTGGAATLGTQAAGFFTAGAGGAANLAAEATDKPFETLGSFAGGTVAFTQETAGQVAEDPVEFFAEEAGEEIGEAGVAAALAGPAGFAFGASPTPEPDTEFNPDQELEPETEQETEPQQSVEPEDEIPSLEQLPSGFTQETGTDPGIQPFRADRTTEPAPGVEITERAAGPEIFPQVPRPDKFDVEGPSGESSETRVRPTEPDPSEDPAELRGENPQTGFTETEQEIFREKRGREDVTLRQGDKIPDRGPGRNQPDPEQTVVEAEETETGGELIFSSLVPVPPGTVEPEPDTEINPQPPEVQPDVDALDTQPDLDVQTDIGPETQFKPETETEVKAEPELDTDPQVDLGFRLEPGFDLGQPQDQKIIPGQQEPQKEISEEPEPENEPGPEVEPELEPEPERKLEPEVGPEVRRRVEPEREGGSEESAAEQLDDEFNSLTQIGTRRTPSLEAFLFGIKSEDRPSDVLTGLEVRPIVDEEPK